MVCRASACVRVIWRWNGGFGIAASAPHMHVGRSSWTRAEPHLQLIGMTETSCVISTVSSSESRTSSALPFFRDAASLTALHIAHGGQFPISTKVGVLGSCGRLAPGTRAKVVKADGSLASVGESGELLVQGPQVVMGYYRNPKA